MPMRHRSPTPFVKKVGNGVNRRNRMREERRNRTENEFDEISRDIEGLVNTIVNLDLHLPVDPEQGEAPPSLVIENVITREQSALVHVFIAFAETIPTIEANITCNPEADEPDWSEMAIDEEDEDMEMDAEDYNTDTEISDLPSDLLSDLPSDGDNDNDENYDDDFEGLVSFPQK